MINKTLKETKENKAQKQEGNQNEQWICRYRNCNESEKDELLDAKITKKVKHKHVSRNREPNLLSKSREEMLKYIK